MTHPVLTARAQWKELAEKATPSPWIVGGNQPAGSDGDSWWIWSPAGRRQIVSDLPRADADFIAAAREAIPRLLADLEEADNVVCWGVDCVHEARALDKSYENHVAIEKARDAERARADEAERKLAALAQQGITIERIERFEAFTPEAKAAYPEKPEFLIRTEQNGWIEKAKEALRSVEAHMTGKGFPSDIAMKIMRTLRDAP
jgi:hypothetical protein